MRRASVWLTVVLFWSGLASLVYEVAWQRILTLHCGVAPASITLVVTAWMLGLGVGAYIASLLSVTTARGWRLYGAVEVLLGVIGLLSVPLLRAAGPLLDAWPAWLSFAAVLTGLSIPAALMGMTLPLLVPVLSTAATGFPGSLSRLYFANTLGAACGALLAGYLLVSLVGLAGSLGLAALVNFSLAAVVFLAHSPVEGPADTIPKTSATRAPEVGTPAAEGLGRSAPYLVLGTGFLSIGYEIVWFRLVSVLVKDSPYAFASMLAVYLVGIALGSLSVHAAVTRRPGVRRELFFATQFLAALTSLGLVVTLSTFADGPLRRLIDLSFRADVHPPASLLAVGGLPSPGDLVLTVDIFVWPAAVMLIPAILIGAAFPLLSSLVFTPFGRERRTTGRTYALLVAGNVLGGLGAGFVLLPALGTERTLLAFGCAGLLFGLGVRQIRNARWPVSARALAVAGLAIAASVVFPPAGRLYVSMHTPPFAPARVHVQEGMDAVVVTFEGDGRLRSFVNGQGHGYRPGPIFFAEAASALSATRQPRRVLVVGAGAGSTVEAALALTEVDQVTLVEVFPSVLENLRKIAMLTPVFTDQRLRIVLDDARRYLGRAPDRYDTILMDPLRTTTAYSNNLHSREFFALAATRLAPNGVLMVGGIGESPVIARTLLEVFPAVRWHAGFCLAAQEPFASDRERFERVSVALPEEFRAEVTALASDWLEGPALVEATRRYRYNDDWRPVSEYYLGPQMRRGGE